MPEVLVSTSLVASITLTVVVLVLLATLPSLVALVLLATPTLVGAVSVPPAVPGMVTLIGHVKVPPGMTLAKVLPALATHAPVTLTDKAPAGTPAATVQVAPVAAAVAAAALVHTTLPVKTAPGPAVTGKPVMALVMSETGAALTVMAKLAVSHCAGTTAGATQIWYGTLYVPAGTPAPTVTTPVVRSTVMPAGSGAVVVKVTLPPAPGLAVTVPT